MVVIARQASPLFCLGPDPVEPGIHVYIVDIGINVEVISAKLVHRISFRWQEKTCVVHLKVIGCTANGNLMIFPWERFVLGTKGVENASIRCTADNLGSNFVGLTDIGHHIVISLTHFGRFSINPTFDHIKILFVQQSWCRFSDPEWWSW